LPALLLSVLLFSCDSSVAPVELQDPVLYDLSATELAAGIRNGSFTSEQLVRGYLDRIEALNPLLNAVIAVNPEALAEAARLDQEAALGQWRGRLHGIPVLVKDNVETRELPTTAGSTALLDNATGRDAPIIARLRAEGAIILGKTNLSEWANFRDDASMSGWSGVGGQTHNPHSLDRSACGSSSGSGAAIAAMFAPLAIGTETNGSIMCPAAMNGIVGFKPTVGLLSRTHIVPISVSQDTAGPMTRTVADAALMLSVMAGSDPADSATKDADNFAVDFTSTLDGDIAGLRIGVLRFAQGDRPAISAAFDEAMTVLASAGAVLVDIADFTRPENFGEHSLRVLEVEFKHSLNAYLAAAAPAVASRSLAELIRFNDQSPRELALFAQSLFVSSDQSPDLNDPAYLESLRFIQEQTRQEGIDRLLQQYAVDVLVMPSRPAAFMIDAVYGDNYPGGPVGAGWLAAIAGYPIINVPMGQEKGLPLGLAFTASAWQDALVLKVGHAYEQASRQIILPQFPANASEVSATASAMQPFQMVP